MMIFYHELRVKRVAIFLGTTYVIQKVLQLDMIHE